MMTIPFRCSSCGQGYPLADHHAGRQVKCAFCVEKTRAVTPDSAQLAPAQRRAVSLHQPDLNPLKELEPRDFAPPPPTPPAPAAAQQRGMEYIAPPPKTGVAPAPGAPVTPVAQSAVTAAPKVPPPPV